MKCLRRLLCHTWMLMAILACINPAASADAVNDRPIVPAISYEASLQSVFNDMTANGPGVDATSGQIGNAWFKSDGASVTASIVTRLAGNQSNMFGIYDVSNPNNTAILYAPYALPGTLSTVNFLAGGVQVLSDGANNFYAGNFSTFGFWLNDGYQSTFYSDDDLNNGEPFALVYRGDNATTLALPGIGSTLFDSSRLLLGWEDLADSLSGDNDFQDFVVAVQGVTPVPEPASFALLSLGGLALLHRTVVGRRLTSEAKWRRTN